MHFGTIVCVVAVLQTGCSSVREDAIVVATPEGATPWTSLEVNDAPEDFHFVVVTDRTGGHREGVFPSAMPRVNLLEPAFVTSVGDLIEGYTEDRRSSTKSGTRSKASSPSWRRLSSMRPATTI